MIKIEKLDTTILTDDFGYAVSAVDSWLDALMTRPNMLIAKHEYGTGFSMHKHRSLNQGTLIDFRRDFKDACNFDPRLSFNSVDFYIDKIAIGIVAFDVYLSIGAISGELVS